MRSFRCLHFQISFSLPPPCTRTPTPTPTHTPTRARPPHTYTHSLNLFLPLRPPHSSFGKVIAELWQNKSRQILDFLTDSNFKSFPVRFLTSSSSSSLAAIETPIFQTLVTLKFTLTNVFATSTLIFFSFKLISTQIILFQSRSFRQWIL